MNDKEWLSKIVIQIVFIIILVSMFFIDKVGWYIQPPLEDIWYLTAMIFAVGIDPIYLYKMIKW